MRTIRIPRSTFTQMRKAYVAMRKAGYQPDPDRCNEVQIFMPPCADERLVDFACRSFEDKLLDLQPDAEWVAPMILALEAVEAMRADTSKVVPLLELAIRASAERPRRKLPGTGRPRRSEAERIGERREAA
jgi:hypothetical protein